MKVELKNDEKETDALPVDDKPEVISEPSAAEEADKRARELEIENARLKGRLEGANQPAASQADQWKQTVWTDIAGLSDEDFQTKYKVAKHQASSAILQKDFQDSSLQTKTEIAELRAEGQISAQYPDYFRHKEAVKEALADASPDVRQNPERLAKFMERAYLAAARDAKENPKPSKTRTEPAKRMVDTFEKPRPTQDQPAKDDKDEITADLRPLARAFGIKSESERKKLMESEYVRMDLGAGIVFEDPEKGFEKVA